MTVRFKGREMAHTELGWKMLNKMVEGMQDIAVIENHPRMEGRMLSMILSPKPHRPTLHPALSLRGEGMRKERADHMPKMKTKRAAAKRLKATGTGKLKREQRLEAAQARGQVPQAAGARLRKAESWSPKVDQPRLKRLVPYL